MKISVIIPCYNSKPWIARALASVARQSYAPCEIIVIDDGSTDGSVRKVETMHFRNLSVIRQSNQGASAARNKGIEVARGELIAFLDADDQWHTEKLEKQVEFFQKFPNIHWCGTNYYIVGDIRKRSRLTKSSWPKSLELEVFSDFYSANLDERRILTSGVAIRKSVFTHVGTFDTDILHGQDTDLWWRIAREYPAYGYFHKPLFDYSLMVPGGISHSGPKRIRSQIHLLRKHIQNLKSQDAIQSSYGQLVRKTCIQVARFALIVGENRRARELLKILPSEWKGGRYVVWNFLGLLPKPLLIGMAGLCRRIVQLSKCIRTK